MNAPEDSELLRRYVAAGAQDAFAELVRRHLDLVYAVALRRCDGRSDLAADVAQQVFVALARSAQKLQAHPALAGWLFSTARHLALTAVRTSILAVLKSCRLDRLIASTSAMPEIAAMAYSPLLPQRCDNHAAPSRMPA